MLFLFVNFIIFISGYLLATRLNIKSLSERFIISFLLWMVQVVVTQGILGIFGILYIKYLIIFNLLLSGLILTTLYRSDLNKLFLGDVKFLQSKLKQKLSPVNVLLIILAVFVITWIGFAAYYLPPRGGADDSFYHLTSIYEFIVKHKIYLLPLCSFKYPFAFPLNAEMFFMWPAIFFHNQRWVDGVQLVFALTGVLVVYRFARLLNQNRQNAIFLGLLFLFLPVVLHQTGSNYIDVITNITFLLALYFSIQFYLSDRICFLFMAAAASGLLLGMKYFFILFILQLQFFIFPKLIYKKANIKITYCLIIFILGGLWYVRNWIELGNPVYPITLFKNNLGVFGTGRLDWNIWLELKDLVIKIKQLCVDDLGLRTFNGGFGLVYWGIAFPCWIVMLFKTIRERSWVWALFWMQPFLIFTLILLNPIVEMQWSVRWGIYVAPIGILAIGEVMRILKDRKIFISYINVYCLLSAVFSIAVLSISAPPNFRLHSVIEDILANKKSSEFKYHRNSTWLLPYMSYASEPLDYLTRDDKKGLNCYLAADAGSFWLSNLYGFNFQNRIWNLEKKPLGLPDAYVYQTFDNPQIVYVGEPITLEEVALDTQYSLVSQNAHVVLFIKEDFLKNEGKRKLLLDVYDNLGVNNQIYNIRKIKNNLTEDIPIVTDDYFGYGFRYLIYMGEIKNSLYWVPKGFIEKTVYKNNLKQFYTFREPLIKERAQKVASIEYFLEHVDIYLNQN